MHLSTRLCRTDCVTDGPGGNLGGICDGSSNLLSAFDRSPGLTERAQVLWGHDGRISQTQICTDAVEKPAAGSMAVKKSGPARTSQSYRICCFLKNTCP